jgi:hypothetical protein
LTRINPYFALSFMICLLSVSEQSVFAQRCIGATSYLIRDEAGKILSQAEMEKLVIKVDGVETSPDRPVRTNPLSLGHFHPLNNTCGQVADVVIGYHGKQMTLYYDILEHNTYYEIDSLPFREGVFHLRSLKCHDGARPPRIDNDTTGKCVVSAETWEGSEKEWVRYVQVARHSGGGDFINQPASFCRRKAPDVIVDQPGLESIWRKYPEATHGNHFPQVDFQREIVIAPYLADQGPSYTFKSLKVDQRGNLTFHPAPRDVDVAENKCSIVFLIINRGGIKTVSGKPFRLSQNNRIDFDRARSRSPSWIGKTRKRTPTPAVLFCSIDRFRGISLAGELAGKIRRQQAVPDRQGFGEP